MTVKTRNIAKIFTSTHQTRFKNLLVSGCSFTYNNREEHSCTWPYYLRDIAQIENVYDASQAGVGNNHIFNSIVYEIETNPDVRPDNTLIIVMWSGLTRTDVIADQEITAPWHKISNYCFDQKFATFTIVNETTDQTVIGDMCKLYKKIISPDAQILESLIKIQALRAYLTAKQFSFVFLSWRNPLPELNQIQTQINLELDNNDYLFEFAEQRHMRIPNDGHPTPDAHLLWTRECLIPLLESKGIVDKIS